MKIYVQCGFVLAIGIILPWSLLHFSTDKTDKIQNEIMVDNARNFSSAFNILRSFYLERVIKNIDGSRILISHDYKALDNAIPIPATLSIDFAREVSAEIADLQVSLVSRYPFKFRKGRSLTSFDQLALAKLEDPQAVEFFELRQENHREILHYAAPIRMEEVCVDCHNTHPDSVKTDWSIGDLRGVQIIEIPVNNYTADLNFENSIISGAMIITFGTIMTILLLLMKATHDTQKALENSMRDQQQSEEQLRRVQKMDAIGQLSGGIAHDFNNLLGIISGNLELASRKLGNNPSALRNIEKALAGAIRGSNLTRRLLSFSSFSPKDLSVVCINEVVKGLQDLVGQSVLGQALLRIKLDPLTPNVLVNRNDLEDAILNLVINARDAMPDGGKISIETGSYQVEADDILAVRGLQRGLCATISITDTGTGISPEFKEKIFEPFFTTKSDGKGTGLGLSMIYGFVKRSNGEINVYSEVGVGTTIRIYLPAEVESLVNSENAENIKESYNNFRGSEKILIVDDEPELREIAASTLSDFGYLTLVAESGDAALTILRSSPDIDLLFTDIVMPDSINGLQLAETILKEQPDLKVLLASGFSGQIMDKDNAKRWSGSLLSKPYSSAQLAQAIRSTLDQD